MVCTKWIRRLAVGVVLGLFFLTSMAFAQPDIELPAGPGATREGYAQTMFDQGYNLYQAGRTEEAVQFLMEAVTTLPEFTKAWDWLARIYMEENMINEAIWAWRKVVQLDPTDARARYFLLKMENWNHYGKQAWEAYEQGQIAYHEQDYTQAVSSLRSAVEANPQFVDAWYWLGISYMRAGDNPNAIAALERVLELNPAHAEAQYWLGQVGG